MPRCCSVVHLPFSPIPYLRHLLVAYVIAVPHATVTHVPFVPLRPVYEESEATWKQDAAPMLGCTIQGLHVGAAAYMLDLVGRWCNWLNDYEYLMLSCEK